jgi:hypothetical protein
VAGAQVLGLTRAAVREDAHGNEELSITIDRQGGAKRYGPWLGSIADRGEQSVSIEREDDRVSRYGVDLEGIQANVSVEVAADETSFAVALASMVAKYVRELAMIRFNDRWSALRPDVKPTAGYGVDGKRWIAEVCGRLTSQERREVVRSR